MTAKAFAPVRVVDFTQVMAGPFCTRLMADVGAEVLKIEPPEGDAMRGRAPLREGRSTYFGTLNAGKRSVVLDLKSEEGRRHAFRLAEAADVVVENFRPGVMTRLGLGWDSLSRANSRLVYCSISGFGQLGAAANRPAYAPMIHATSGLDMALMGFQPGAARPAPTGMFYADVLAGIYAWGAIQTALLHRERTGMGQFIDVALLDSLLSMMVYECQEAQFPQDRGRHLYTPVRTLDGFVMVVPLSGKNFASMVGLLGNPEWATEARFQTAAGREAHWQDLMRNVEQWTSGRGSEECEELLLAAGVPCARYRTVAEALSDPATRERGVMGPVEDAAGTFGAANPPFRMSRTTAHVRRQIPELGEATDAVLTDLLTRTELES
jgi:CoA:oxalate CoA-transferase